MNFYTNSETYALYVTHSLYDISGSHNGTVEDLSFPRCYTKTSLHRYRSFRADYCLHLQGCQYPHFPYILYRVLNASYLDWTTLKILRNDLIHIPIYRA
jgi:hypothetical protein